MLRNPPACSVEHPEHRRIRRHHTEQLRLVPQDHDISQAIATIGERHHQMREHHPRIMGRTTPTRVRHRRRQAVGEPDPIRELGEQQRSRVTHHTPAVTGHLHPPRRASNVHPGSALLVGTLRSREAQYLPPEGRFRGRDPSTTRRY